MTVYRLDLKPGGIIPPDIGFGVTLRRTAVAAVAAVVATEAVAVVVPVPIGTDRWYDAPNLAVIPFRQIGNEVAPDLSNIDLSADDNYDYEGDIPGFVSSYPWRSVWWQLTVPAGVTDALLSVDTWQTVAAPGGDDPDTTLMLLTTDEAFPLGPGIGSDPLPTAATDFTTMVVVASSNDDGDPGTNPLLSRIDLIPLGENKVYWVRVDIYDGGSGSPTKDAIYRVRFSLSFTP